MSSNDPSGKNKHTCEPGSLVVWRWLGLDRYLPAIWDSQKYQPMLRGCASVSGSYLCRYMLSFILGLRGEWYDSLLSNTLISSVRQLPSR